MGKEFVEQLCDCWVTNPETWEDQGVKDEGNSFTSPAALEVMEKSTACLSRAAQWPLEEAARLQ